MSKLLEILSFLKLKVRGKIWAGLILAIMGAHLHPFWQSFAFKTVPQGAHLEAL